MFRMTAVTALVLTLAATRAIAFEFFCPTDNNNDGISDDPNVVCLHMAAGDGMVTMADGKPLYVFGFSDVTGPPSEADRIDAVFKAEQPAPTITMKEGQKLYLNLSIMADGRAVFDSGVPVRASDAGSSLDSRVGHLIKTVQGSGRDWTSLALPGSGAEVTTPWRRGAAESKPPGLRASTASFCSTLCTGRKHPRSTP